jgi:hypothetical protein
MFKIEGSISFYVTNLGLLYENILVKIIFESKKLEKPFQKCKF